MAVAVTGLAVIFGFNIFTLEGRSLVPVAARRVVRSALRTAIQPQVEQTAALGIVFLPGAMTGLILAGVDPLEAVRAQLALMYVI